MGYRGSGRQNGGDQVTLILLIIAGTVFPVAPGESIQNAMNQAFPGDTVLVLPGIHYGSGTNLVTINGEHNGVVLTGDTENPASVVLSGNGLTGSIISIDGLVNGAVDSSTVISGLEFTGGNPLTEPFGGAVYTAHASPLIEYCLFRENSADNGGAVYSWKGAPAIRFCLFEGNECQSAGGAVYLYSSEAEISGCRFVDNKSWDDGGGLYTYHCSPMVFNCLFTGGYAHDDGGGIYCYALSNPDISFCTFYGNESQNTGSAVYFRVDCSPPVSHCIIAGNTGPALYIQNGGEPVFTYNCVWGNPDGNYGNLPDPTGTAGNISADPLLQGDMFLSHTQAGQPETSPCIDAGGGFSSEYGLEFTWTRTDSVPDSSTVDMGFHHGPRDNFQSGPENENSGGITVFPNPASSSFTLCYSTDPGWSSARVFNLSGRLVYEGTLSASGSHNINAEELGGNGVYIVRLSGGGSSASAMVTVVDN